MGWEEGATRHQGMEMAVACAPQDTMGALALATRASYALHCRFHPCTSLVHALAPLPHAKTLIIIAALTAAVGGGGRDL